MSKASGKPSNGSQAPVVRLPEARGLAWLISLPHPMMTASGCFAYGQQFAHFMDVSQLTIEGWLTELGMQDYQPAFADNAVEPDVLPTLTIDDLPLFSATAQKEVNKETDFLRDALNGINPDDMSPREAQQALYRLKEAID